MHARFMLIALAASLPLAGCLGVDNMLDLKQALGAAEEPVLPPVYAPSAKATVDHPTAPAKETLRFSAAASSDPQGLPLTFTWSFGDGASANGREAGHAYERAGSYAVTLTAVNSAGVADVAVVRVEIQPLDLPPHAAAVAKPQAAWVGQAIEFSSGGSYDPEGRAFRTLWDFGDGGSSVLAEPKHAFAKPGRHTVALDVVDASGQTTRATLVVPVSLAENRTGILDPTNPRYEVAFPVPSTPATFRAVLAYDGAPANDLRLELRDGAGRLLDFTGEGGAAVGGGRAEIALASPSGAAGDWTLTVVRHAGLRAPFTLSVVVGYA